MIKIPNNGIWSQLNSSDKFGSIAFSKNINCDEGGYLKLSPRTVNIYDDSEDTANIGDTNFDYPVAFGRYGEGSMRIATTNEPFNLDLGTRTVPAKTISEDTGTDNPNLDDESHGVWWQDRFYESTDDGVSYNDSGGWPAVAPITGLTSGKRHYMTVFKNRQTLLVTNGNVVKQYNTSHTATIDLALPTDFEAIGIAYNNNKAGIVTRLGSDTEGQNSESFFFVWDGTTTAANAGFAIGSYAGITVVPYRSSFLLITNTGQLLFFNGGGFEELAHFPIYVTGHQWGDLLNPLAYGDNVVVDGDVVLINLGFELQETGRRGEKFFSQNPSGVWCYDPKVGLYHRYSASNSRAYFHSISQANVNTTTNVLTTSATIPATGNPLLMATQTLGGLSQGVVYYVIKESSTTFKIAQSKELALVGVALDITSAAATNYIFMYDLKDYGVSYFDRAGAIALWGNTTVSYRDVVFGGRLLNTSLADQVTLCTAVPFLENRGYAVLQKLFLNSATENIQKIFIKHRALDVNDVIVVKVKTKDYVGIPVSSPNDYASDEFTWTSNNEGYTSTDLSEAKAAFDAGEELEIEFTAGAGAGQCVKVTDIDTSGGVYSFILEDDVLGAASGLKSHFVIDNWKFCKKVTYSTQDGGVFEVPVGEAGRAPQLKIELRGYETTIEDILVVHAPQVQSE